MAFFPLVMYDNTFSIDWFENKKYSITYLVNENIHEWVGYPFHNNFGCFPSTGCYRKTLLNLYLAKSLHHKKTYYLCKCIDIKISLTMPPFPRISSWPFNFQAFPSLFPNKILHLYISSYGLSAIFCCIP